MLGKENCSVERSFEDFVSVGEAAVPTTQFLNRFTWREG